MKEYPLTARELWTLGGLQASAALVLGLAGACFGFWLNLEQTVAFSQDADPQVLGYWEGIGTAALLGSVLLGLVGIGLFVLSGLNVRSVIRETKHEE